MPADTLEILLIEDNPGDARLIEEMLHDVGDLLQRVDTEGPPVTTSTIHHEQRLAAGLERLDSEDVDVVLLDLGLPDSNGLETLAAVADETGFVPIVVLTGLRDEEVGIQAIQRGAQDYLVKEDVTSDLLIRTIHHALERNRQERAQARQVEQLATINRLNRIGQDVTHAVITTETREELERTVCERFVAAEQYLLAWIGEVDRTTDEITPRVSAGVEEGYLTDATITTGDTDRGQGPAGQAVRTQEVQVVNDLAMDPSFEPWREEAIERGYRASAAVPITYEGVLYGVLNLYAASTEAFSEPEIEILSGLGDVIGHAITAIERRDALVSETVRELEFEVTDIDAQLLALTVGGGNEIHLENVISTDDHLVAYGEIEGLSPDVFREAAENTRAIDEVRILGDPADAVEFELATQLGRSLFDAVSTRGGVVESVTIADGDLRFVLQFPSGRDMRELVELVQDHCPGAEPRAQRTVERNERAVSAGPSILDNRLTEKQRAALEAAYFAGYFDWPRTSSSEEIADLLGVTPATFTHHLRAAEASVFEDLFAGSTATDDADWSAWTSAEPDAPQ